MKKQISMFVCVVAIALVISPFANGQGTLKRLRVVQDIPLQTQEIQELRVMSANGVYSTIAYTPRGAMYTQPFGGWSSNPSQLMHNPQVRKDLELDQDQIKEMAEIQKDFQKQIQDGMKRAQSGKSFDQKKWNEIMQQITKERKTALGAVLLPHQSQRLNQISTQMEMKNRGDAVALVGGKLAEELGIDGEQKKRLQKRSAEIKADLANKIEKLKEDARKELLRELKPGQRKKLDELVGEKFEPKKKKPAVRRYK